MNGHFFVNAEAAYEFVMVLLEAALTAVAIAVALVIASPSLERALEKFERWCGRGN